MKTLMWGVFDDGFVSDDDNRALTKTIIQKVKEYDHPMVAHDQGGDFFNAICEMTPRQRLLMSCVAATQLFEGNAAEAAQARQNLEIIGMVEASNGTFGERDQILLYLYAPEFHDMFTDDQRDALDAYNRLNELPASGFRALPSDEGFSADGFLLKDATTGQTLADPWGGRRANVDDPAGIVRRQREAA